MGVGGGVSQKQLTQFTVQLSILQDAGLPIVRSLKILEQQMKQLQENAKVLDSQLAELIGVIQSLEDFKSVENKTRLWVPISNGIFTKAELIDNRELMVNVGADVVVKKSAEETKSLIAGQMDEIKKVQQKVVEELQRIAVKAMGIEKELNKLLSE